MIDSEENQRADHGANKSGALSRLVPADRLTEIGSNQGAYDAEQCGDDEASWVAARHDDLGHESGEEADDDRPDNMHGRYPPEFRRGNFTTERPGCHPPCAPWRRRGGAATGSLQPANA